MRIARRVTKLETRTAARPAEPEWLDEDGWLARYEAWGAAGLFAHEPDFPGALAGCRAAIGAARLSVDPPWVPPEEFEAGPQGHRVREAIRRGQWRDRHFPAAAAALGWLNEMRHRAVHGVPPVGEAEFAELAAWLAANAARLDVLADRNSPELLDVGAIGDAPYRTRVRSWMVAFALRAGPRAEGSGRCAETVRRLRALFPADPSPALPEGDGQ